MEIRIKRVYENVEPGDGNRILVDRLWPRGLRKDDRRIGIWMKDISPSDGLRKWFSHDPDKWKEFKEKYFAELKEKEKLCTGLFNEKIKNITLLYSAKDEKHNQAVALKEYYELYMKKGKK